MVLGVRKYRRCRDRNKSEAGWAIRDSVWSMVVAPLAVIGSATIPGSRFHQIGFGGRPGLDGVWPSSQLVDPAGAAGRARRDPRTGTLKSDSLRLSLLRIRSSSADGSLHSISLESECATREASDVSVDEKGGKASLPVCGRLKRSRFTLSSVMPEERGSVVVCLCTVSGNSYYIGVTAALFRIPPPISLSGYRQP
ncbi:hypothetical protein LY76DRAFT_273158 [Colletotrichum caudatum]|nr:hypothetical protein LY76DRAFT_273158 [Colletotrichum caudatum]